MGNMPLLDEEQLFSVPNNVRVLVMITAVTTALLFADLLYDPGACCHLIRNFFILASFSQTGLSRDACILGSWFKGVLGRGV